MFQEGDDMTEVGDGTDQDDWMQVKFGSRMIKCL